VWIFGVYLPVLVRFSKKNLATLRSSPRHKLAPILAKPISSAERGFKELRRQGIEKSGSAIFRLKLKQIFTLRVRLMHLDVRLQQNEIVNVDQAGKGKERKKKKKEKRGFAGKLFYSQLSFSYLRKNCGSKAG
jgi:hypothetical protein